MNAIHGLFYEGIWRSSVAEVCARIQNHFKNHYINSELLCAKIPGHLFKKKVDACDNSFSVAPFTIDEVKKVIWACDSNKSPGSDGFSFRFIKEDWRK